MKKNKKLNDSIGPNNISVGSVGDAVRSVDVVVLARPWNAVRAALPSAGNVTDKIVIDCTNPLRGSLWRCYRTQPLSQNK
ncbi:MAG: NAD(P)-binding domain-containing protein [Candidatus Nitrosopolaris sp.]